MHPNCRSTTIEELSPELMKKLERRARDPETGELMTVPGDMTYREWKEKNVRTGENVLTDGAERGKIETGSYAQDHFDRKTQPQTQEEDLKETNPGYSTGEYGYTHNCQRCVPTYALRKQGYNVEALPWGEDPVADSCFSYGSWAVWTKAGSPIVPKFTTAEGDGLKSKIEKRMEGMEDGALIQISCAWDTGGRHTFVDEKENGTVMFVDPQTGNKDVSGYFARMRQGVPTYYWRIDDAEIDEKYLKYICKNKGGS